MGGVEFRLLGTVTAGRGDQVVELGHGRRRCVLAALLVDANQVVSADQLLDRAWGDAVPRQGRDTLYAYLSRLRRACRGLEVEITRRCGGYVLAVDPENVDLHRFHRLLARGRAEPDPAARLAAFDRALGLWRGAAFAGLSTPWLDDVREGLAAHRFCAELDRVDLRLELGLHGELVTGLAAAVREHPLDERLTGQFMLALYRSGRQAEALAAYQGLRDRLAEALGVDPGPEVRRLHTALLRQAPEVAAPVEVAARAQAVAPAGEAAPAEAVAPDQATAPATTAASADTAAPAEAVAPPRTTPAEARPPAQVPCGVPHFVGRAEALRELGPGLSVVVGTGGVGKSALVVHWAHRHGGDFPDGQLYVDLHGYGTAEPMAPSTALEGFLRALGVERIPPGVDERAALYRSALAGRRMVVLLDNARSAEQVRPLLPGRPGCAVLVTSRDDLAGLVARDGARRITVGRLGAAESLELLRRVLGAERVAAELPAATELVRRCAGLPLALRVAAERAAGLADLVAELADPGALDVPGDPASAVRSVFSWSYRALPEPAARLFRLLGWHPGPDHGAAAAAALAGVDLPAAHRLLDVLRTAHLVEQTAPDRFAMHDLLRLYARQLGADPAAVRRLAGWYLGTARAAAELVHPAVPHLPWPPVRSPFTGRAEALAWLDTERHNLLALVRTGSGPLVWELADALHGYFSVREHHDDLLDTATAGLRASVVDGDLRAQAVLHLVVATARLGLGERALAEEHFEQARRLGERTGWDEVRATALGHLGTLHRHRGRLRAAAICHASALAVVRSLGAEAREAGVLCDLGEVYYEMGHLRLAERHCQRAVDLHRAHGSRIGEATGLCLLARIAFELGDLPRSLRLCTTVLRLDLGARGLEAAALAQLALADCALGAHDRAEVHAEQALDLARETGCLAAEADAHNALGLVDRRWNRFAQAAERHRHALDLARADGRRRGEVESLVELSAAVVALGCPDPGLAAQAVALAAEAGFRVLHGRALTALAQAWSACGAVDAAVASGEEALGIHLGTGHRLGHAATAALLARLTRG
ncbi:AfsR/SARP family transcriptional regulator [Lentzea chajnantorensis]